MTNTDTPSGLIFPSTELMPELIQRGRDKTLRDADYAALLGAMNGLYHAEDYEKSFQKVVASFATLEKAMPVFKEYQSKWGFKTFPAYTVQLTHYGTGGSYDPESGSIILWTEESGTSPWTSPGSFFMRQRTSASRTSFRSTLWTSESKREIVDKFVLTHLLSLVPTYQVQPSDFTDLSIDRYLDSKDAWDNLPERLKDFSARG